MHGTYQVVSGILNQLRAEAFLQIFEENLIDDEALNCLTVDHLRSVIPLGIAVKFINKCSKLKFENKSKMMCVKSASGADSFGPSFVDSLCNESSFSSLVDDMCKVEDNVSFPPVNEIKRKTPLSPSSLSQSFRTETPPPSYSQYKSCVVFKGPSNSVPTQENDCQSIISFNEASTSTPQSCQNSVELKKLSDSALVPPKFHPGVYFTNGEILKQVLMASDTGKEILAAYETENSLNHNLSLRLCDIILSQECQGNPTQTLIREDFMTLAQSIVQLFPNEQASVYYRRCEIKNGCSKVLYSRGRLFDKYNTRRKHLRRNGVIPKGPRKGRKIGAIPKGRKARRSGAIIMGPKSRKAATPSTGKKRKVVETNQTAVIEALQALKLNKDPEEIILQYWHLTREYRYNNVKVTIQEYFNEYPCLQDPELGPKLIYYDFIYAFGAGEDNFLLNWNSVSELLLQLAVKNIESNDPKWAKILIETDINFLTPSVEQRKLFGLLLLPYFFPRSLPGNQKNPWKPSTVERAHEFIKIIPVGHDIDADLEDWKNLQQEKNRPCRPLTVLVGSPAQIEATFVLIGDQKYHFPCIFSAFDFSFKSFYSLTVKYPPEIHLPYRFIEKYVYKIEDGKSYSYLSDLWNKLKAAQRTNQR